MQKSTATPRLQRARAGLFLLGAPATLAIGFAADRVPRKWLLVFIIVLGGVASLGTASAQNFPQLFGWRALTGISLGAAFPLNFSLLADLFPPARRTSMSGRFGLSIASGQAFGQALSGFVGGPLGWRVPFILVGGLFLALAGVVIAFFCEPVRGACDGRAGDAGGGVTSKAAGRDLFQLFTTPTVLLVFLQGIPGAAAEKRFSETPSTPEKRSARRLRRQDVSSRTIRVPAAASPRRAAPAGCVPWSIIGTYLNDFVHVNLHLSVQHATLVLTALAVGGFAGQLVGGEVGQRLYLWKKPACCCQMGVSKVFSILFLVLILLTDTRAFPRLAAFALALGFWASQTGPIVYSCLQNTTSPGTRASAFAVLAIFDDLGKGGGPWVVAKLVRAYGPRGNHPPGRAGPEPPPKQVRTPSRVRPRHDHGMGSERTLDAQHSVYSRGRRAPAARRGRRVQAARQGGRRGRLGRRRDDGFRGASARSARGRLLG